MNIKCYYLLSLVVIFASCNNTVKKEADTLIPVSEKALTDSKSVYYADFESYPKDQKELPIGVFDSGTGGLTVLEAFLALDEFNNQTGADGSDGIPDFSGERFIYLADQANMPYGNYSAENKNDYLRELIIKDALFLTKGDTKSKVLVVACNTATAYGLDDINKLLDRSKTGLSVVGVINAGVNAVLDKLSNKEPATIGVLATPGTIASGGYQNTIHRLSKERAFKNEITVVNQAGKGFAESVDMENDYISKEANKVRDNYRGPKLGKDSSSIDPSLMKYYNFTFADNAILFEKNGKEYKNIQLNSASNYARFHLVSLFEKHKLTGSKSKVKSIILGCTHYPFLLDTINKCLNELRTYKEKGKYVYKDIIDDSLSFVDPAVYTAKETYRVLRSQNKLVNREENYILRPFISVPSDSLAKDLLDQNGNLSYSFKYGREVNNESQTVKVVPFSKNNINPDNLFRIESRLPLSFQLIKPFTK